MKISFKYIDYNEGQWTTPVDISVLKLEKYLDDHSLEKFKVILSDGSQRVYTAEH